MTSEERSIYIEKLRAVPGVMEQAVRNLTEDQLNTPYGEGKWTVRQVVHHLADADMNFFIRMKLIVTEDVPVFKPYNQNLWSDQPDVLYGSLEASLAILRGVHERMAILLSEQPETSWARTGNHPERGPLSLERLLVLGANHAENHIKQITDLRQRKGW